MQLRPSRRTFLRSVIGSAGAFSAGSVYAFGVEPAYRLRVQPYAPAPAGWPDDLPLTIAAIADLHIGEPYMPLSRIEEIVEITNDLGADLVVLLGDYPAGHPFITRPVSLRDFAGAVRHLRAPLGVYAILGNHDWWDDPSAQAARQGPPQAARELDAVGIPVLENDAIRLTQHGRPFWLLGLGDQLAFLGRITTGVDDLPRTLARVTDDAPVILLAHEPDIFPHVPSRVALTLSGHTHGGQVRLFGYSPIVPSRYGNRFAYGHIVEGQRDLIVSGGLGTSIAPVRLGVPPEIVLVQLGRQTPSI